MLSMSERLAFVTKFPMPYARLTIGSSATAPNSTTPSAKADRSGASKMSERSALRA